MSRQRARRGLLFQHLLVGRRLPRHRGKLGLLLEGWLEICFLVLFDSRGLCTADCHVRHGHRASGVDIVGVLLLMLAANER